MRLTKEREAELRADNGCEGYACDRANVIADLLAELDAVRAERDEWKAQRDGLVADATNLTNALRGAVLDDRAAGRADERAKVVEFLRESREHDEDKCAGCVVGNLADAIERGEHEVKP